jgi:hypothetical protein
VNPFYIVLAFIAGTFTGVFLMSLMFIARGQDQAPELSDDEESVVP